MEDIENLTRQDLVDYYKLYYAPEQRFRRHHRRFLHRGNFAEIKKAFGRIPRRPDPAQQCAPGASRKEASGG